MSTIRRKQSHFLGKGPNGRNLCFCGCGREVGRPRINWFSDACVQSWQEINDPATIRRRVLERDKAVCAHCGVDTEARAREAREWRPVFQWIARRHYTELLDRGELPLFCRDTPSGRAYHAQRVADGEKPSFFETWSWAQWWADEEVARRFGKSVMAADGHTWEADHIIPVVEGGGQCGLDNYRTLCLACHRAETAALARRRAEARRRTA
jgi:5-methylcytosine-specific restriction endonuclease McrA